MANQHIPVTGGCLCGAVRYEAKEPPTEGYYCHCTMCRRHYGSLFAAALRFPGVALKFTKCRPKYYRSSAWAKRGFCSDCGSSVAFFFEGAPNLHSSVDGSKEAPSPAYISDFLATSEGLSLTKAFMRIKQPKLRRRIVDLVEEIAGDED